MKRRNELAVWLLWPLLTLGIYHLVWYYKIHREVAEFDRRRAVPTSGPVLVLIFLGWTLIAPLISYYNCGTRIRNCQRAAGRVATCSPGLGCFLMLIFGVGTLYYQSELNKVVDAYPNAAEGTQIPRRNRPSAETRDTSAAMWRPSFLKLDSSWNRFRRLVATTR